MSAEYETVANLWNSFHQILQDQEEPLSPGQPAESEDGRTTPVPTGLPGTGTHIVTDQTKEKNSWDREMKQSGIQGTSSPGK